MYNALVKPAVIKVCIKCLKLSRKNMYVCIFQKFSTVSLVILNLIVPYF